ncbi:fungal-specific transcription factor domain-containing protein [Aspergillus multicolor]|uniref:transcription factor domain-containing protein n=1 Tax=Aspergillus multicolor TaxID=41759 RepID=UPI003CCE2BA3
MDRFDVMEASLSVSLVALLVLVAPSRGDHLHYGILAEAKVRIRELEALVTAQRNSPNPVAVDNSLFVGYLQDPRDLEIALTMFQREITFCGVGTPGSTERESFCSAVLERTGSHFDVDQFVQGLPKAFGTRDPRDLEKARTQKWPPRHLVQLCIHQYAKIGLYSVHPVANVKALQALLDENTLETHTLTNHVANLACLVAFTAQVTVMHRLESAFSGSDPDAYLRAVLSLVPRLLIEEPSVRSLEAFTSIATYLGPLGHTTTVDSLLAVAVRMIYSLGAHRPSVVIEAEEGEHLRNIFWYIYGFDKTLAIRFGRPPLFNDVDLDLRLPDGYVSSCSDDHFFMRPLSSQHVIHPSDLRMNLIKSKIHTLLYSDHGRAQPGAKRLQYIRELDEELNALKSSFPDSCWPDVFATGPTPDYTFHDLSLRGVNLHLDYYFCLGKIHGASSAYGSSSQSWSFLPSSAELFYQESRIILLYVYRVRHALNWHTFWIWAQYILTAVVSLFRFIIAFPTAETFDSDIQILETIADIFSELDRDLTNQGSASELRKTMAWIAAADFDVKIVICGNHDVTLDAPFYYSNSINFHSKHPESPRECLEIITNASPSVVFLQHQSALVRLRKAVGPNTIFKVFGSPYSQCDGNWAFLYEAHEAEQLWRDIPLDADVVVTHMPPHLRCELDNEPPTESSGLAVTGCAGLRERLRTVRPCVAVCGHVHGARGYERIRWGSSVHVAAASEGDEGEPKHTEDQIVGGVLPPQESKKQSLVDLTGKRAPRLENDGLGFSRANSLFPSSNPPDVVVLPSRRPGAPLDGTEGSRANAVEADTEPEAESADGEQIPAQRRETCIVNAAITATNWPHHGGRKFHPGPIVVDLELPVWTNDRPETIATREYRSSSDCIGNRA